MSSTQNVDNVQTALELYDLNGVDDLETFARFIDVMRRDHRGRDNAIPSAALSRELFGHEDGTSTIRDWKQAAVQDLGLPIAYERPDGYYVIETEDELAAVKDYYFKRITSMKETVRAYERAVMGTHRRQTDP